MKDRLLNVFAEKYRENNADAVKWLFAKGYIQSQRDNELQRVRTKEIRNVDANGRIVIPKGVRQMLEISQHTEYEFFIDGDKIILKPYKAREE